MPETQVEYELKRNQHRNWQSMLQIIGLRCQPVYISTPTMVSGQDLSDFGTEYSKGTYWKYHFGVEQEGVFDLPNKENGLLLEDLHNVPMIIKLTETESIDPAMIDTFSDKFKNTIILK